MITTENKPQPLAEMIIESRNKLRTLIDSLKEEVIALDRNLYIVSVNKAYIETKKITFQEAVLQPYFPDVLPEDPIAPERVEYNLVTQVFETGHPAESVITKTDASGDMYYWSVSVIPAQHPDGNVIQATLIRKNITKEMRKTVKIGLLNMKLNKALHHIQTKNKHLEDTLTQLKTTQAQFIQAEKMASLGQLAAGMAHEINNPIGFVNSNLQSLTNYFKDLEKIIALYRNCLNDMSQTPLQEAVAKMEKEIDIDYILLDTPLLIGESLEGVTRVKQIVDDLKEFAAPGESEMKAVDLNKSIDAALNIIGEAPLKHIEIEKNYCAPTRYLCRSRQLNQAILNILINAVQAVSKNGKIGIQTTVDASHITLRIADNGNGIPAAHLGKVFDPFFTTKDVGHGKGLGLHTAYHIVKEHQGTLQVLSKEGAGTTAVIRLPLHRV